jgi:5'-3' exonuclease
MIRHYSSIALVDLSYLFTRNYRGAGVKAAPNAGAERTIQDLKNIRDDVDHVVICLDAPPYLRRDKFPEYKAHREAPPPEELEQKRAVVREIKRLGYNVARAKGYEADDVIATLARAYGAWCPEVRMVASDKDIAQCITKNVVQYVPSHGTRDAERRDHLKCKVKFGVYPAEMPLWQALAGDSDDNVPGVKDVGKVRAAEVISALNYANKPATIAGLADYLGEAKPKGGKWTAIANNWETLKLSLDLVTLDASAPVDPESLLIKLEPEEESPSEPAGVELDDYVGNTTPASSPPDESAYHEEREEDPFFPALTPEQIAEVNAREKAMIDHHNASRPSPVQEQINAAASEAHQRAADAATARVQSSPANDRAEPAPAAPAGRPAVTDAEFDPISPPPGKAKAELPPLPPKPAPQPAPVAEAPKPPPPVAANPAALAKRAEQQIEWGIVNARLQPTDLQSAWTLAKWYATSGLFSGKFKAEEKSIVVAQIFAIIHRGVELGLDVGSAINGFHMIDGKPSMSADLIRTLAKRHPDCEYFYCESSDDTQATWVTRNRRHPPGVVQRFTYTIQEAGQVPSLWKKDRWGGPSMWEKYPKQMLAKTASTMLARQEWESTMVGFYCPEELGNGYTEFGEQAA